MNCDYCGRDLNRIGQDNMSHDCSKVVCQDCAKTEEAAYMAYYAEYEGEE